MEQGTRIDTFYESVWSLSKSKMKSREKRIQNQKSKSFKFLTQEIHWILLNMSGVQLFLWDCGWGVTSGFETLNFKTTIQLHQLKLRTSSLL